MTATPLTQRTTPQLRQLVASWVTTGTPQRLYTKRNERYDVVVLGIGQDTAKGAADPFSQRGTVLVCRFDVTGALLTIPLRDLQTAEPMPLFPTDPRHPDYEREEQVTTPISVDAMAARKRRTETRHDQL